MATTGGVPSGVSEEGDAARRARAPCRACATTSPAARAAGRAGSRGTCGAAASGKRVNGPLLVITQTTRREVVVELREAGPEPERELHGLGAGDPVRREGEADDRDPVVLGARGEEEGLVGDAERAAPAGRAAGSARARGRRDERAQRHDAGRRSVERDVERAARACRRRAGAAERAAAWSCPGAGSREAADGGEVAPRERAAAAAEAEDLEEQAPDDRLLERQRPEPPGGEGRRAAERAG